MRFYCYILIVLSLGCYKKNEEIEAIPIDKIAFKTTLKNHTPGIDYVINKTLEVSKELIIEEGVEIIVEAGCEVTVIEGGSIASNGSSSHPVVFKSKDNSGRWKGIIIFSKEDNRLSHTQIIGAGSAGNNHAAVEVKPTGKLSLSHCRIEDNADASGLLITEKSLCTIGEGCEFLKNNFPVQMELHATISIGNGCNLKNNKHDAIMVRNQDGSALTTKSNLQLSNLGLPYFFTSWLTIEQKILTVNAGVTLLFENNTGIKTTGYMQDKGASLVLNGTASSRITLGSLSANASELWNGLLLSNGDHRIYNTTFNKSNSKYTQVAILNLRGNSSLDCKYSVFNADKSMCNISLVGGYIAFNPDIFTRNTFTNGLLPCVIL